MIKEIKLKIHDYLAEIIYSNKFLINIIHGIRKIQFVFKYTPKKIRHYYRKKGIPQKRYAKLKDYKNIHEGKRCFIIATGPSLTMDDIESLKGEYTISMNSICKLYDKTEWRPTYFAIQDNHVFEKMEDTIKKHKEVPVFISDNIKNKYKREPDWIEFPTDTYYHAKQALDEKYFAKFSGDAYEIVYDGYSIAYSCLELAVYMGFKEIYLLGADCTYSGPKEHFVDSGVKDRNRIYATPKLVTAYKVAKEYADTHDIKIYNATRGGVLEVFPRVKLEEVLKKEVKI